MIKLLILGLYVGTSLFGLYKLKVAPFGVNVDFAIGFTAYAVGFLIWLFILKVVPLSIAFPLASGSLMLGTQIVGILVLGEAWDSAHVLGVALLLSGVVVLSTTQFESS